MGLRDWWHHITAIRTRSGEDFIGEVVQRDGSRVEVTLGTLTYHTPMSGRRLLYGPHWHITRFRAHTPSGQQVVLNTTWKQDGIEARHGEARMLLTVQNLARDLKLKLPSIEVVLKDDKGEIHPRTLASIECFAEQEQLAPFAFDARA
jgi:hypothetical protein